MSQRTSISGLTDDEAQEFHAFWIQGTGRVHGSRCGGPRSCLGMASLVLNPFSFI